MGSCKICGDKTSEDHEECEQCFERRNVLGMSEGALREYIFVSTQNRRMRGVDVER